MNDRKWSLLPLASFRLFLQMWQAVVVVSCHFFFATLIKCLSISINFFSFFSAPFCHCNQLLSALAFFISPFFFFPLSSLGDWKFSFSFGFFFG